MIYLARKYRLKPRAWGPASAVNRAVIENCDALGLPVPRAIFPLWEGVGDIVRGYGTTPGEATASLHSWASDYLDMVDINSVLYAPESVAWGTKGSVFMCLRGMSSPTMNLAKFFTFSDFVTEQGLKMQRYNADTTIRTAIDDGGAWNTDLTGMPDVWNTVFHSASMSWESGVGCSVGIDRDFRTIADTLFVLSGTRSPYISFGNRLQDLARGARARWKHIFIFADRLTADQHALLNDVPYSILAPVPVAMVFDLAPAKDYPDSVVVDNVDAGYSDSGTGWSTSTYSTDRIGTNYRYTNWTTARSRWAKWSFTLPADSQCRIYGFWNNSAGTRDPAADYEIKNNGSVVATCAPVDQRYNGNVYHQIWNGELDAGTVEVILYNGTTDIVIADAIKLEYRTLVNYVDLASTLSMSASMAADMARYAGINATLQALTGASAGIAVNRAMSTSMAAATSILASLSTDAVSYVDLIASIASTAGASAALSVTRGMAAQVAAASAIVAGLTRTASMATQLAAATDIDAALDRQPGLSTSLGGATTASGALDRRPGMGTSMAAASSISGALAVLRGMQTSMDAITSILAHFILGTVVSEEEIILGSALQKQVEMLSALQTEVERLSALTRQLTMYVQLTE